MSMPEKFKEKDDNKKIVFHERKNCSILFKQKGRFPRAMLKWADESKRILNENNGSIRGWYKFRKSNICCWRISYTRSKLFQSSC